MAVQATEIRRWAGGHCPFLAAPQRFAGLIDDIVKSRLAVSRAAG
jgi:hypothetical protein